MDPTFLILIFVIFVIIFFVAVRIFWKSTVLYSLVVSFVISVILINLIDPHIPCDHKDNKQSLVGIFILDYIALIIAVLFIIYATWKDVDYHALCNVKENVVF